MNNFDIPVDYYGRQDLDKHSILGLLDEPDTSAFTSEKEYCEWFVGDALEQIIPQLTGGEELDFFRCERRLPGTRMRIDVLARTTGGRGIGFELKAKNKKNPQTHKTEMMRGIGQTLMYQDLLTQQIGDYVPVFLTSDFVPGEVASLIMRHGIFINLLEANVKQLVCIGNHWNCSG